MRLPSIDLDCFAAFQSTRERQKWSNRVGEEKKEQRRIIMDVEKRIGG